MLDPTMESLLGHYNEGLSLYKSRKFSEARDKFRKALDLKENDGPSRVYLERCEHFIENPPPEDWDGVFVMTTK